MDLHDDGDVLSVTGDFDFMAAADSRSTCMSYTRLVSLSLITLLDEQFLFSTELLKHVSCFK